MRAIKSLLIAGAATATLIGAAAAAAPGPQAHVLIVRLPNGAVEQIRYFGDTPPKVVLSRAPAFGPVAMFGPNSPFAEMDHQMAAMMAQAHAVQARALQAGALTGAAGPGGLQQVVIGQAPAGSQSFSTISTFSGGHACTKSVQVLSQGAGRPPQVLTKTSGDCGAAAVASPGGVGIVQRQAAPANAPHAIAVKASPKATHPTGGTTI
jgi:hypothetical protein